MITVNCTTNWDEFKLEKWPKKLQAVPDVGDWIKSETGKIAKIVKKTWMYDGTLQLEIHRTIKQMTIQYKASDLFEDQDFRRWAYSHADQLRISVSEYWKLWDTLKSENVDVDRWFEERSPGYSVIFGIYVTYRIMRDNHV